MNVYCKYLADKYIILVALIKQIFEIKKKEYLAEQQNNFTPESKSEDDSYKTPQILINQLFRLLFAGQFDEQTVKEQLETILISGSETSALSVSYIILMLAMHPEIQERLYDELHSLYTAQDEETTYEHMQRLTYMEQIIKETLRLFPVGPFIVRRTNADVTISNCTVPKNSYIALSIFNLHRVCTL